MARYTGYVEAAEGPLKGYGQRITDTGVIEGFEPGGRPGEFDMRMRDLSAPEGDFVRTPEGKYITDFDQPPQVSGRYKSSLVEQGRAFDIDIPESQPDSADAMLEKQFSLAQNMLENEYIERSSVLGSLPPESRQYQILMGNLEANFFDKLGELKANYVNTKRKHNDIDKDTTLSKMHGEMAKNTLQPIYKFPDMSVEDLRQATITPEQQQQDVLIQEMLKLERAAGTAKDNVPLLKAINSRREELGGELARQRGEYRVEIEKRPRRYKGPSEAISEWMSPKDAVVEYEARNMPIPAKLLEAVGQGSDEDGKRAELLRRGWTEQQIEEALKG